MIYRAKESKAIKNVSWNLKYIKIAIGKRTKSVNFYWLNDQIEIEDKFWHPFNLIKNLILLILFIPLLMLMGPLTPISFFYSFNSKNHPEAKKINSFEIDSAIKEYKSKRYEMLLKHKWV